MRSYLPLFLSFDGCQKSCQKLHLQGCDWYLHCEFLSRMQIYSVKVIRIIYTWPEKTHFVFQGGEAYKGGEFWNVKVKGWIGDELS